jgi:DNA invertase Pin-like site-specific DNA recombinase
MVKRSHQTTFLFSTQVEEPMQVIGYTRVSTEEQDLTKQEHLLFKYAQQHAMQITDFIQVEISSRKNTKERRIDEVLARPNEGDILLVAELSRLGRNMFEVLNLINQLSERGVKLVFVRQPELSTTGPHGKLLLAIHSYFAEAEREFISVCEHIGCYNVNIHRSSWAVVVSSPTTYRRSMDSSTLPSW